VSYRGGKQLIGLVGAGVLIGPALALGHSRLIEYYGHVDKLGGPRRAHNLFIERKSKKAGVSDLQTRKCGEFHTPFYRLEHDSFSFHLTGSNGYGLKGSIHLSAGKATGVIEAWSPHHRCDTGAVRFSVPRRS
jgi:hypothetical protein